MKRNENRYISNIQTSKKDYGEILQIMTNKHFLEWAKANLKSGMFTVTECLQWFTGIDKETILDDYLDKMDS